MSLVFKTPKSTLNTTSGAIQIKNGDNLQEKSVTYNQEGEFTVVPDPGMYGLSKVDITIDVPSDVHNQNVTIGPETTQQVVTPEEGYTGFGQVTVDAVTSAIDANIEAGNIKKDVTILGVTGNYDPQPDLEAKTVNSSTVQQVVTPTAGKDGLSSVTVEPYVLQAKTAAPSTSQQVIEPDNDKDGLSSVTISAVTSSIDANISAGNIKKDVTILGVTGNFDPTPNLSNLNITPSTNAQEYNPAISGVDGYSLVSVSAVTSAIDNNIAAGNIKKDVTILGVTGNYDPQPNLQSKSVNPTTSAQTVSPDSGYDGLSQVSVAAVTSAIDANIAAGNIKNGVSILGVTGTVVEAKLQVGELPVETIGTTEFTPGNVYNGFSAAQVTVPSNPLGAIGTPFSSVKNLRSEFVSGYIAMEVAGSEFIEGEPGEEGYYTVEDQFGNVITELNAGIFNQFTYDPFDFTGRVITVGFDKADVTINEDDSNPNDIKYTYEIATAQLVGINGNLNDESWFNDKGEWIIGRNEYAGGWIYTESILGSYGNPFDNGFSLDETFLKVNYDGDLCWNLVNVQSGSIDPRSGCYVAEDELGVTAYIRPYLENPDYDPEQPEDPVDNPSHIFPANFDLTGLSVEVSFTKDNSAVTDNPEYDPEAAEPTPETERKYNVEIGDCEMYGINWNQDMDTWEQCYFPPAL